MHLLDVSTFTLPAAVNYFVRSLFLSLCVSRSVRSLFYVHFLLQLSSLLPFFLSASLSLSLNMHHFFCAFSILSLLFDRSWSFATSRPFIPLFLYFTAEFSCLRSSSTWIVTASLVTHLPLHFSPSSIQQTHPYSSFLFHSLSLLHRFLPLYLFDLC